MELSEHGIDFSFESESELADLMHEGFDGLPFEEFAKPIVAVKEYFSCTADIQEITKQIATQVLYRKTFGGFFIICINF